MRSVKRLTPKSRKRRKSRQCRETSLIRSERIARNPTKSAGEVYHYAAKPNAAADEADAAATKYEKFTKRTKLEQAARSGKYKQRRNLVDMSVANSSRRHAKNINGRGIWSRILKFDLNFIRRSFCVILRRIALRACGSLPLSFAAGLLNFRSPFSNLAREIFQNISPRLFRRAPPVSYM